MCENCIYYQYDNEFEDYFCNIQHIVDEDDFFKINYNKNNKICPYFKMGDEYTIINKQI